MKYFLVLLVLSLVFVGLTQGADARGPDEPCSYLKPTKYIKDSSGNCILDPQNTASNVASAPAPATAPTHTTTIIHAPTPVPATAATGSLSDVGAIALLGIFALVAYKIFGDKLRHPRMKFRPRPTQKSENFAESHVAVEDDSSVSDDADRWTGGQYSDSTKEEFK